MCMYSNPTFPFFLHRYICHICDILQLWLASVHCDSRADQDNTLERRVNKPGWKIISNEFPKETILLFCSKMFEKEKIESQLVSTSHLESSIAPSLNKVLRQSLAPKKRDWNHVVNQTSEDDAEDIEKSRVQLSFIFHFGNEPPPHSGPI